MRRLRPTRVDVFDAASATIPLAVVVLVAKCHEIFLGESLGAIGIVALSSDLLFLALWCAAWSVALHLSRGTPRRLAAGSLRVSTGIVAVVAYGEHLFFAKTGAHVDWYMLAYAVSELHDLHRVLLSEVGGREVAGLGVVLLLGLAPRAMRRLEFRRRGSSGALASVFALTGLAVAGALSWVELPGVRAEVRRSPVVELGREAFAAWLAPEADPGEEPRAWWVDPVEVFATGRTRRHNVVVIVLESVRAQATTMHAPALDTTPFMNELVETRARLVERSYAVVPHTSKALVGILCGIPPKLVPAVVEATSGGIPTSCLARILRQQRYATAFFQPAEERYEARHLLVENMGFETFRGKESIARGGFDESSYFGYEDDAMLEPSFAWIDEQDGPFFVTYLTLTAHHRYQVPSGFPRRRHSEQQRYDDYLNTVRYTDRFVEQVVTGLDERGLLDDTVVVIMGDHGEGFGEHGRHEHDTVIYEEGVRVPMILMGPGTGAPGRPIGGLRQVPDTLPTVLDALGLELTGGALSGRSLLGPPHEEIFLSCWYPRHCMANLEDRIKTIYHYDRRPAQVFDVLIDPFEERDLREEHSDGDIERRVVRMKGWQLRANARYSAQQKRSLELLVRRDPPTVQHPVEIRLGEHVRLRGYELASPLVPAGRSLDVTFYFEALADIEEPWELFVHITDSRGRSVRNADRVPADETHPVDRWKKGEHITDPRRIFIRHGTIPGPHHVALGLWRRDAGDSIQARALPTGDPTLIDDERRVRLVAFEIVEGDRGD